MTSAGLADCVSADRFEAFVVAILGVDGDLDALMGDADKAMYQVKAEGRNAVRFFGDLAVQASQGIQSVAVIDCNLAKLLCIPAGGCRHQRPVASHCSCGGSYIDSASCIS